MIFIIDEEISQISAWERELRARGYEIECIRDADQAYARLEAEVNIEIVLIDVMLAAGEDPAASRYDSTRTDSFRLTGVCLAEDLIQRDSNRFRNRMAFLTNVTAGNGGDLPRIEAFRKRERMSLPILRKFEFDTPFEFGNRIAELLSLIQP